jgi:hypothetical protein
MDWFLLLIPVGLFAIYQYVWTREQREKQAYTVLGTFVDGVNFTFGTSTGTQIGTAANQRLAFYGKTPVVQPTMGAATAGPAYTTHEQTMLQDIWNLLRTLGLGS